MDRRTLKIPFTLEKPPDWECPACQKGLLRFRPKSFVHEELFVSRDRSDPGWDPNWISYVYTGLLVCNNDRCKETVVTAGVGSVDWSVVEDENGQPDQFYYDHFTPRCFIPHLKLLRVPSQCPETVRDHLERSFSLFFADPQSSANCVRASVEALMTDLGVRRFDKTKGRRRFISLHQRISLMPKKYEHLKELMLAIKWLGNAGSHDGHAEVSIDDVMDSYDLMEHVLSETYKSKDGVLRRLAKKVNKKKGPIG